jgi:hypothetical protein
MRQTTHFAQPPPATSHIAPPTQPMEPRLHRPETATPAPGSLHAGLPTPLTTAQTRLLPIRTGTSNPRQPTISNPSNTLRLFFLPAQLPQPGVHPLPRTPGPRPHGSRRIGILHNRSRFITDTITRLHGRRRLRQDPHRRRHRPFVHPIRPNRRRHEHRLERQPLPTTAASRHTNRRPNILKPPHLPRQQPCGKNRRRQQRPEQHNGPPPNLPTSPRGHRQKLAMGDEPESDQLPCLYRSSEHP